MHYHYPILKYTSSIPMPNHLRRRFTPNKNASIQIGMVAAVRDLALRQISSSSSNLIFQIPISFFSVTINSGQDMATNDNKPQDSNINKKQEREEEEEKKLPTPPLPPPPEKPEPGDCCGSGCVRCVWDVYYEELEEYDKLCKSNSDSKPS